MVTILERIDRLSTSLFRFPGSLHVAFISKEKTEGKEASDSIKERRKERDVDPG